MGTDAKRRQAEALFERGKSEIEVVDRKADQAQGKPSAAVVRRQGAAAVWIDVRQLVPLVPKVHPPAQLESIRRDYRIAWTRPLVARTEGLEIIGGHGARQALIEDTTRDGAFKVPGSPAPWHAPVRLLEGLSLGQARYLAINDNETAALSSWDEVELGKALAGIRDEDAELLALVELDDARVADLLGEGKVKRPGRKDRGESALPPVALSEPGKVYHLGQHRLWCGDSLLEGPGEEGDDWEIAVLSAFLEDVTLGAVVSDPPFAIYGSSSGLAADVTDDKIVRPFFRQVLRRCQEVLPLFGAAYICCDWRSWASWWQVAKATRLEPKNLLVWDKGGNGLGNNWANTYELIGYFVVMPAQRAMKADRVGGIHQVLKPNMLRHSRVRETVEAVTAIAGKVGVGGKLHNAQKPIPLLEEVIRACPPGDVLDMFAGSGSTMIAAEEAGRRCHLVEVEPRECDKIRRRWTRYALEHGLHAGTGALEPLPVEEPTS